MLDASIPMCVATSPRSTSKPVEPPALNGCRPESGSPRRRVHTSAIATRSCVEPGGMRITQLFSSSRTSSPASPKMRMLSPVTTFAGAVAVSEEAPGDALSGILGRAALSPTSGNTSSYSRALVVVDDVLMAYPQVGFVKSPVSHCSSSPRRSESPRRSTSMRGPGSSSLIQRRVTEPPEFSVGVSAIVPRPSDNDPMSPTIPLEWHDEMVQKVEEQTAAMRHSVAQRASGNKYRTRPQTADLHTGYQIRPSRHRETALWSNTSTREAASLTHEVQRPQSACVDKNCRNRTAIPLSPVSHKSSFGWIADEQILCDPLLSVHTLAPAPSSPFDAVQQKQSPTTVSRRRPHTADATASRRRRTRSFRPKMTTPSVRASHYRPIAVSGDSFAMNGIPNVPVDQNGSQMGCAPNVVASADEPGQLLAMTPTGMRTNGAQRTAAKPRVPSAVVTGNYMNTSAGPRTLMASRGSSLQAKGTTATKMKQ